MRGPALDLKTTILDRMAARAPFGVWTPADFADAGPRDAVDQALHRLVRTGQVRRIARGLYDSPSQNSLTRKPNVPDPRAVIDALARRDNARMLVDGITAANDLGLSDAVPSKVVVHTDARLTPFDLGALRISFRKTAPSKLYWAGRPAMRVVQALHDSVEEPQARRLAREVALLLQAALLHELSPPAVFSAFCESRLHDTSDVFGLLGPQADLDALIQRALPT